MFLISLLIWATALFGGVLSVWTLAWAVRRGEFRDPRRAAASIFDSAEPVGQQTDFFPGARR